MSDSESAPPAPRPTTGGKTLESIERPRYKSYRKKYRKMRHTFDTALEENKRLFREEQKLELTAKRLREELDGLLDLCLELNQSPALPPELRFDVSRAVTSDRMSTLPLDMTAEMASDMILQFNSVRGGPPPEINPRLLRQTIDEQRAALGGEQLEILETGVPHAVAGDIPQDVKSHAPAGYLSLEQEVEYVKRLDAKLDTTYTLVPPVLEQEAEHWAKLTPREFERQMELLNPQSQHNWLKTHPKLEIKPIEDDNESLASHENNNGTNGVKAGSTRKKTDKSKTLAKQVGDRAVERAREGWSPGVGSGMEEDDFVFEEGLGSGRKRARDTDGTYRLKGGKSGGGGGGKGKRKRSGEDMGVDVGGGKKAKVEEE